MFLEAQREAWVEINLGNLAHNIREIKKNVGEDVAIIGVIKADAYGHGSVQCAKIMIQNGIKHFAVATIPEAIVLREAGIKEPIMILGLTPDVCAFEIAKYDLTPVVSGYEKACYISEIAREYNKKINIILAIDTGMGRIGYQIAKPESMELAMRDVLKIDELPYIRISGLLSHFASTLYDDKEYTYKQINLFNDFYEKISLEGVSIPCKMIANSAAIIENRRAFFDAVRPGLIMYGYYPTEEYENLHLDLKPVMSVKADIVFLKRVPKGTSISYGRKFTTERESVIATIALGYADGYSRVLNEEGEVIVNGKKCKIVGAICMDQMMIDVTDAGKVNVGDEAIIMGTKNGVTIDANHIAKKRNTISYEVLCDFGLRLPKVYINKEA